jgi:hypothetical protein
MGGNSRTSIILTCSPTDDDLPETLSTLQFGQRAQHMQNKPRVNRMLTVEDYKRLLEKAKETMQKQKLVITALEREIETLRSNKVPSPTKAASAITFVEDVKQRIDSSAAEESEITSGDESASTPAARAPAVNPVYRLQRLKNHIRKSMTLAPAAARELAVLSEQVEHAEAPKESMDLPDIGTPLQVSSESDSGSSDDDEEDPAAVLLPPISISTGRKRLGTGMRSKYFTPRTVAALSNEMVQHLQEENKSLQDRLDQLAAMTQETEGADRAITDSIVDNVDSTVSTSNTSSTSVTSAITPTTVAAPAKKSSSVGTNEIDMIVVGTVVLFAALLAIWILSTRTSVPVGPYVWAAVAGASAGSLVLGWGIPNV